MEITLQKSNQLKAVAVLMMLFLHLFNRPYQGFFKPLFFIGEQPLSYYVSLFCDACVPIFCFVSGYGLYFNFVKNPMSYQQGNRSRIKKLYINYWIILILFAVVLGLILNKSGFPGSILKFLTNFLALSNSYNSAWWFFLTYLLLVASSPFLFRLLDRFSIPLLLGVSVLIYFVGFYFRVYQPELSDSLAVNWLCRQVSLFCTSLLPFYVGAIALKTKWNTKISVFFTVIQYKNSTAFFGIVLLVVVHGFIPNFSIAPFLAIPFLFLFVQIKLPFFIDAILDAIAPHTTNMWLVHMFFYMVYFEKLIYSATYVLPVFLLLIVCSIVSSIVINKINNQVLKTVQL